MANLLWRFGYRFGNDNNFRLAVFWGIGLVHLIFNLVVFGFGPAIEYPLAEESQRFYNRIYHGRYMTDWELNPPWWLSEAGRALWARLRGWSWTTWVVMFVLNTIYIPISRRDEFSRVWRAAVRSIRERRGSPATGSAPPTAPAAGVGAATAGAVTRGILGELWASAREILTAAAAIMFTHQRR